MKTDVEELSPTRVKLTVEVPFEELKSSLDKAYRDVGRQVRIPGFRPGHVPPRVIDQRLGRAVVLEQAVQDAVPQLYGHGGQVGQFELGPHVHLGGERELLTVVEPGDLQFRLAEGGDLAFLQRLAG